MYELVKVIILGIVQGFTEWLPVSSSAHLVIFQKLFGMDVPVLFDIMLHLGTVAVVVLFFRKDIKNILGDVIKYKKSENARMGWFIVAGSVITAIIGFAFMDEFERMFQNLLLVGIALIITGVLLFLTRFSRIKKKKMNTLDALLIGASQGIAIAPGISRSGATISMGLFRGIDYKQAAKFSFLLAIPAILGAALLMLIQMDSLSVNVWFVLIGTLAAMVVGYFSLKFLMRLSNKFHYFAWYCWALGIILILLQLKP
jgi:undecaprenyl-diphosphatase